MFRPLLETSLLDIPDGTELHLQVRKPHGGLVQLVAITEDDRFKMIMEWNLNEQGLIDKNMANENLKAIPKNHPTNHGQLHTLAESTTSSPSLLPRNLPEQ